jgi:hypothetical protein
MAVNPSTFGPKPQFELSDGTPAVGNKLFFYVAGSVNTKQNTYTDSTGGVANANPVILNTLGQPTNEIWFTAGQTYKVVYAPSTDTDPPTSPIWTVDNVRGINDTTGSQDQWVAFGGAPTFVSATSFTLVGDQTSTFQIGRRIKTTNTSGTIYSTITGSAFGALTTVTVVNDSGVLDAGLSSVTYGFLSASNASVPGLINIGDIPLLTAAGSIRGASASSVPINLSLAYSVAASALTIAIKGRDGNDPSSANPVLVPFRNVTSATGDYSWIVLTSATSLAVSSGSTLGSANSVAFRGWVVAFNDAGTLRLGVINCNSNTAGGGAGRDVTAIFPLGGWGISSSTAEGGAGAADSAQTFYTGSAVSSKSYTTLGYFTYESGLATAGTYASAPTRAQLLVPGVPLPGQTVQVQRNATGAMATGTTIIPADDTIPQITEGDQYLSQAITPSSAANALDIRTHMNLSNGTGGVWGTMALFQDATANALTCSSWRLDTATAQYGGELAHMILASTTSATTLRVRMGADTASTSTINGQSGARKFGSVYNSYLSVIEVMG